MKKGQQPKLFLDKIDGTIPIPAASSIQETGNRLGDYLTHHFFYMYMYSVTNVYSDEDKDFKAVSNIDTLKVKHYMLVHRIPEDLGQVLHNSLFKDPFAKVAALSYKKYCECDSKNYIISSPLTKCLAQMDLNLSVEMLPEKFSAYFQPTNLLDVSDGSTIFGAFVYIGKVADSEVIAVTLITSNIKVANDQDVYAYRTFLVPRHKEGTLEELCNKYSLKNEPVDSSLGDRFIEYKDSLKGLNCLRAILNAILYVSNPNEEFKEQYNEFAKNEKKRAVQEKVLTTKSFYKIGYDDAEYLKLLIEKETTVKWHVRNQPYGPGKTLRKKILIAPHTRTYRTYLNNS